MVAGLLDHFPHLSLGKRQHSRVRELRLAELPHRNFGNQQDAVPVGVVEHEGVLRIVNRARQHRVQHLHVIQVMAHRSRCFREPLPGRIFVPCQPGEPNSLPVEEQVTLANLHRAHAERVAVLVQRRIVPVLERNNQAI